MRFLVERGYRFQAIDDGKGGSIPYPRTLREAREWVKQRTRLVIANV